jgi:hypothetical protein
MARISYDDQTAAAYKATSPTSKLPHARCAGSCARALRC